MSRSSVSRSVTYLQYLQVSVLQTKNMFDDYGQKWFHTLEQFETNRLFARDRNPELESVGVGPDIFTFLMMCRSTSVLSLLVSIQFYPINVITMTAHIVRADSGVLLTVINTQVSDSTLSRIGSVYQI